MDKIFHPSNSRGTANYGWLDANYSFSFSNFYDPEKLQFGKLRVLNDDTIKGGTGFSTHAHRNMEIITIPLSGSLRHKDSMGHEAVIMSGEVQVMSAGTGVEHSEFNNNSDESLNMLQLWILPEKQNIAPRYAQKDFTEILKSNSLIQVVAPLNSEPNGALQINQNAFLYLGEFEQNHSVSHKLNNIDHGVYIFVIDGKLEIEDQILQNRDALSINKTEAFEMKFKEASKLLLIEVPLN